MEMTDKSAKAYLSKKPRLYTLIYLIKELTTKELEEKIVDERNLLLRQKLNHAVSPLDNPNKMRITKKEIARLLTELQQRKIKDNPKSS